jgi:three-Cys-motif partner protein
MKHSFGGPWTQIKLEMLRRYLVAFNTALQYKPYPANPFRRIYIDAFAGTGECEIKSDEYAVESIAGSAKIALHVEPAFDEIHLIDLNEAHVAELQQLAAGRGSHVHVHRDDANVALDTILGKIDWKRSRGVLFLDPYGMNVPLTTLQRAAETRALDVWYLFPLSAVYRQAANDFSKIDESKLAALDSALGTCSWREAFYQTEGQDNLLGAPPRQVRVADPVAIAAFVQARLACVFPGWVSDPLYLRSSKGAPLFALFCCISNPADKAVALSRRMASHILGNADKKSAAPSKRPANASPPPQGDLFT